MSEETNVLLTPCFRGMASAVCGFAAHHHLQHHEPGTNRRLGWSCAALGVLIATNCFGGLLRAFGRDVRRIGHTVEAHGSATTEQLDALNYMMEVYTSDRVGAVKKLQDDAAANREEMRGLAAVVATSLDDFAERLSALEAAIRALTAVSVPPNAGTSGT